MKTLIVTFFLFFIVFFFLSIGSILSKNIHLNSSCGGDEINSDCFCHDKNREKDTTNIL